MASPGDRWRGLLRATREAALGIGAAGGLLGAALGGCSLDSPELPDGWERPAVEAARGTPGVSEVRIVAHRVDGGIGKADTLAGSVRLTGDDPKGTYRRMLVRVTDALGPDIDVIIRVNGVLPDGSVLSQSDLGVFVATSRELHKALH